MNYYKRVCFVAVALGTLNSAQARQPEVRAFLSPASTFQLLVPGFEGSPTNTLDDAPEEQSKLNLDHEFASFQAGPTLAASTNLTKSLNIPAWMRGNGRSSTDNLGLPPLTFVTLENCAAVRYAPHPSLEARQELRRRRYFKQMAEAACEAGVPVELFDALIVQESRYNPLAVSSKGASGLTQLMPGTARSLGVFDRWNVSQNLRGGARYLRKQLDTFGEWALALGAYNAGPGNVTKYGGLPPFRETRGYVRAILSSINSYQMNQARAGNSGYGPRSGVVLASFTD